LREKRRLRLFEGRGNRGVEKRHNEELNELYSSPNNIRVIKSRRIRLAARVAHRGRGYVHTGFWWGKLRGRYHLEEASVDGKIILRWIFRK
jgi:hypothetical protein